MTTRCHCGQPLHYVSPAMEAMVGEMVARKGAYVVVTVAGNQLVGPQYEPVNVAVLRSWLVPRHYIALHGLKAAEVGTLGFVPVDPARGYVVHDVEGTRVITCLRCGHTSANAADVVERYCGHCHRFHEEATESRGRKGVPRP